MALGLKSGMKIQANTWPNAMSVVLSFQVSMVLLVGAQKVSLVLFDLIEKIGCAIVTTDKAFLFTDGRYFLQAEKQLDE